MSNKKYASLQTLQTFLTNLRNTFSELTHKHNIEDITDYVVDAELSATSTNPVQNKTLDAEFEAVATAINALDLAIDNKADAAHVHSDIYYTKEEIQNLELITVEDIDSICGSNIVSASEVTF